MRDVTLHSDRNSNGLFARYANYLENNFSCALWRSFSQLFVCCKLSNSTFVDYYLEYEYSQYASKMSLPHSSMGKDSLTYSNWLPLPTLCTGECCSSWWDTQCCHTHRHPTEDRNSMQTLYEQANVSWPFWMVNIHTLQWWWWLELMCN